MKVLSSSDIVKTITEDGGGKTNSRIAENLAPQSEIPGSAAWHHLEACDKCRISGHAPDLLIQNLHSNKIPRACIGISV